MITDSRSAGLRVLTRMRRGVAVAAGLFVLGLAGEAWATCPSGYPIDCSNGYCCPEGEGCCGSLCCKPGSTCSGGTCVSDSTGGTGTTGTSRCPNGKTCAGGKICCGDNLCYDPGSRCCGGGSTGNVPHGCGATDTCCGDRCVSEGMLCCNEHPGQGCIASIQVCCDGKCCDRPSDKASDPFAHDGGGCALGGPQDSSSSSAPGFVAPIAGAVAVMAWVKRRRRRG